MLLGVADVYKRKTPRNIAKLYGSECHVNEKSLCDIPGWGKWVFPLRFGRKSHDFQHRTSLSPCDSNPFFVFGDWSGTVGWIRKILPFLKSDRSYFALEDPLLTDPTGTFSGRTQNMNFAEYCLFLAKSIVSIQKRGPYYLLAYSVGGLVAFEVSRHLIAFQSQFNQTPQGTENGSTEKVIGSLILIDPQPVWDLRHNSSAK